MTALPPRTTSCATRSRFRGMGHQEYEQPLASSLEAGGPSLQLIANGAVQHVLEAVAFCWSCRCTPRVWEVACIWNRYG
jgi:hypothetical protein